MTSTLRKALRIVALIAAAIGAHAPSAQDFVAPNNF